MPLRQNRGVIRRQYGRVPFGQKSCRHLSIRSGVRGSGIVLHILAIPDRPARDERNGSKGEHKGEIFHCAASG